MKLQTEIVLQPGRNPIDYDSKVLLLGSCFSENIGAKLKYFKFQVEVNPFGIIFHPVAIERLVERALNETFFSEKDIFFHNEQWHSFEAHSSISHPDKDKFLNILNNKLKQLNTSLNTATHIFFTYGTSWVYRHIAQDELVANCHKLPAQQFLKELLPVEDVTASIDKCCTLVKDSNAEVSCILTVSPVRHLKDGFVENTRSKAHLIAGLHEVVAPRDDIYYFPSYEILMDQLRDYRFYEEDMLHPNGLAIGMIWEKLNEVWISISTSELQKEIDTIQKGLQHRPFHAEGEAHKNFQKALEQKIARVKGALPFVEF